MRWVLQDDRGSLVLSSGCRICDMRRTQVGSHRLPLPLAVFQPLSLLPPDELALSVRLCVVDWRLLFAMIAMREIQHCCLRPAPHLVMLYSFSQLLWSDLGG